MILSYIYIKEHLNLKNIDVNLYGAYNISFDMEAKKLTIAQNKNYIADFWGSRIDSLSVLVGDNGAGKTNILDFIVNSVIEGTDNKLENGFLLFFDRGNQSFSYYGQWLITCNIDIDIHIVGFRTERHTLNTLYYTSHFQPVTSFAHVLSGELHGLRNISDGYRLIHDMLECLNTDSDQGGFSFRDYLSVYESHNQLRMALFVSEYYLNKELAQVINFTNYILLAPKTYGYSALKIEHNKRNERSETKKMFSLTEDERISDIVDNFQRELQTRCSKCSTKDRILVNVVYNILLNLAATAPYEQKHALLKEVEVYFYVKQAPAINNISEFIESISSLLAEKKTQIKTLVKRIDSLFKAKTYSNFLYVDLRVDGNAQKFQEFTNQERPKEWLTMRSYDLHLSHSEYGGSGLSSGERQLLQLFSRIRYYQKTYPEKIDNAISPYLLLLDEADVGLHPEWQRNFIAALVAFIETLFNNPVQVILTTQSPIILSDIPSNSITFLKRDEKGVTTNQTKEHNQTFCTNIFGLYRNSFFLEQMLGSYAYKKIEEIRKAAAEKVITDEHWQLLQTIGDPFIQSALFKELEQVDPQTAIKTLESRLESLRKAKKQTNNE